MIWVVEPEKPGGRYHGKNSNFVFRPPSLEVLFALKRVRV